MLSIWETYPATYRAAEVAALTQAAQAGECVAVTGPSGCGKSNLLGFVAHRVQVPGVRWAWVDANALAEPTPAALWAALAEALHQPGATPRQAVRASLTDHPGTLAVLMDRFDALPPAPGLTAPLRALRDAHKYRLSWVIALRRPLPDDNELAELFYAHTLRLGALAPADAHWSASAFAARRNLVWNEATLQQLAALSGGYPSLLRAACEAHAAGCPLEATALNAHPAVQARQRELRADTATPVHLVAPLWSPVGAPTGVPQPARPLTAKEHALLSYLQAHPNTVCAKDDLIRAVWPEDKVWTDGVRDDSLAQLVRRLREKVEPHPAQPRHILTAPGRGYLWQA